MAAKTCTKNVMNFIMRSPKFYTSIKLKELLLCRQLYFGCLVRPCLGGSSLHSLPGNRFSSAVVSSPFPSLVSCRTKSTRKADIQISMNLGVCGIEKLEDFTSLSDKSLEDEVTGQINESLEQGNTGRLYAVVYIRGIQHKVTAGDLIVVKYDFPPNVGDRLRLEKVLAVGGKDFSMIGQPLLSRNFVRVDATVVEKTLSHNRVWFVYQKRRSFKKFHLYREIFTVLAINSIQVARLPEQNEEIENQSTQKLE
ncbi:50S ribosomal protein l21 [Plakobranchus ocellatus]|uniref:Large ribosomal subunit protein bL21m n=1 Tax=Plakobranchus ocellatus TaxID=259542 RepID=A0AAV3ZLJ1_9GAST|nr:50S ribosomal protein l21 [Plakobranchus ocellatus]